MPTKLGLAKHRQYIVFGNLRSNGNLFLWDILELIHEMDILLLLIHQADAFQNSRYAPLQFKMADIWVNFTVGNI